jgi:hypothetical protein
MNKKSFFPRKQLFTIACIIIFLCMNLFVFGNEYKVVIPQIGDFVVQNYTNLIKSFADVSKDTFTVKVIPFARAVHMIETKEADVMVPIIAIPDVRKYKDLKFDYSTIDVLDLAFVLYANKSKNIDIVELKKGNPKNYKIETDISHLDYYTFKCMSSTNIDGSLQKVDRGQIDGYILGQPAVDASLKNLGLKNIKRQYFDMYKIKFMIQKGKRGTDFDKMLTDIINKLTKAGTFQKVMADQIAVSVKYLDWQP